MLKLKLNLIQVFAGNLIISMVSKFLDITDLKDEIIKPSLNE